MSATGNPPSAQPAPGSYLFLTRARVPDCAGRRKQCCLPDQTASLLRLPAGDARIGSCSSLRLSKDLELLVLRPYCRRRDRCAGSRPPPRLRRARHRGVDGHNQRSRGRFRPGRCARLDDHQRQERPALVF